MIFSPQKLVHKNKETIIVCNNCLTKKLSIMEIKIKPNDFKEQTECRDNVVQHICDAFLSQNCWKVFHPCNNGACRHFTNIVNIRNGFAYGFSSSAFSGNGEESITIRKCEVEKAISLLIQNGYHLYRELSYGSWVGYMISNSPRLTEYEKVNAIRETDWSGYFL